MQVPSRRASLLAGMALLAALITAPGTALAANTSPSPSLSPSTKLTSALASLVAGLDTLDPRIPQLVAGYRQGEIPVFAYLDANTAARRTALQDLGARVLRSYSSVPAVAIAASPVTILRIAEKPWVAWLSPVEVVVALDGPQPYGDQTRGTTADLGAPTQWDAGITGEGVRIAILDTGIDAAHPDLNDQDFRRWSALLGPAKVVEQRNFVGGQCAAIVGVQDGNGHGTHVAGIAAGTGSGNPADASDNGKYTGIAPDAELAVAKVLTDAGAGINSDLIAAMEWAATPAAQAPLGCGVGAQIVNMSLGSEVRPGRLNSGSDLDLVSIAVNRLAVKYGTLFVASAGNQGPFIGSQLEAPGAAAQVLSVGATAKDYDLNHDDTYSGDNCAGYMHPSTPPSFANNTCDQGPGTQPSSLSSLSSRGPSGDLWLRPDITAPGYYIVSAQSSTGTGIASQDINLGTQADPLYATASGTSMAAPAASGSAALLLEAYRNAYGKLPSGASGTNALAKAPTYALVRAALMNTAGADLLEARLTSKSDLAFIPRCSLPPDQVPFVCDFVDVFSAAGYATVYEVRNGPSDPYVGPLGEGAGKVRINPAVQALRDGVVIYSAGSGSGADAGTGPKDFQGTWQIGAVTAATTQTQKFVVHGAPASGKVKVTFGFSGGHPSDGSRAIPTSGAGAWSVTLPSPTNVSSGSDAIVTFKLTVPASAAPGLYTGVVVATTSQGVTLRVPVFAAVAMHDPNTAAGNAPGPQAAAALDDVFAKSDTLWPSVVGSAGTGAGSDWNIYPVELASGLTEARFRVWAAADNETYDIYVYDAALNLISSTHPFLPPGQASGATDASTYESRTPSTAAAPQALTIGTPAAGRHYVVVNRAVIGRPGPQPAGNVGGFRLTLDEVRGTVVAQPSQLAYEGDYVWTVGASIRLAARLTNPAASGTAGIAGRVVTFTVDGGSGICGSSSCQATTDYNGIAQLASAPIALAPGVHEVHARFSGDASWLASADDAFVIVIGSGGPPPPPPGGSAGKVTAGGWFVPSGSTTAGPVARVHFAFHAASPGVVAPTGELRYRDIPAGLDITLVAWTAMLIDGDTLTLTGTARDAAGSTVSVILTATDAGDPGNDADTLRLQVPDRGYDRPGTVGGGNVQIH
jgi:subtilisin family serine protease